MMKTRAAADLSQLSPDASVNFDVAISPVLVAADEGYDAFLPETNLEPATTPEAETALVAAPAEPQAPAERPRRFPAWAGPSAVALLALVATAEGVVIFRTWAQPAAGLAAGGRSSAPAEPGATSTIGVIAPEKPNGPAIPADRTPAAKARPVVRSQRAVAHRAPAATSGAGWLRVVSPLELDIVHNGQVIGTTLSPRITLPAGDRTLELINNSVGYREQRLVHVEGDKTATVTIALPRSRVHINAVPWATVWVNGRSLGDTPLGNVPLPIGPHEFVFRHPQLGEKRVAAVLKVGSPARVSVDMRAR